MQETGLAMSWTNGATGRWQPPERLVDMLDFCMPCPAAGRPARQTNPDAERPFRTADRRMRAFWKSPEEIYRPAMRAHFAGNLEGDFQLCQRLPNTRRRNGAEHGTSLIADNITLIPANDAVQAAVALRIAKV